MSADWQPIATAPQDWSWFLAWCADLGHFVYRLGPGLIAGEEPEPTHWMPLPQPPSSVLPAASPEGRGAPTEDDFTPEQIAELRQDFDEWLARRQGPPIPEAALRMLAPWKFEGRGAAPQEDR